MRATPLRYFCEPHSRYMKIAGSRVSLPFPLHWLRGFVDTALIFSAEARSLTVSLRRIGPLTLDIWTTAPF